MRVSTTITDEMNIQIIELAKEKGLSKDKMIALLLTGALENKHNERGAGRKPVLDDKQINSICYYRACGYTIKAISRELKCSVGLVHKIINENNDLINNHICAEYGVRRILVESGQATQEDIDYVNKYKTKYE